MRRHALLSLFFALATFAVTLLAEDSPLVQASKRSHRNSAKPRTVITNKELKKSGGHITTTTKSAALPVKARSAKQTPPTPTAANLDSDPVSANIPASIAAKAQLTKPRVAPLTKPAYTSTVTPQYTPPPAKP
jgi:hypothetical protein